MNETKCLVFRKSARSLYKINDFFFMSTLKIIAVTSFEKTRIVILKATIQ